MKLGMFHGDLHLALKRLLNHWSLGLISGSLLFWITFSSQGLYAEPLKDIHKSRTFRIGVKNNLPLLGQVDTKGQLSGFEIELAQAITTIIWGETVRVEYIPLLNQDRLSAVINGTVDIAIANIHVTESRRRVVFFSQPYLDSETSFISVGPSEPTRSSLKNSLIGVLQGSIAIGRVQSTFPHATFVGLKSYQEAIQKLNAREIDAFAGDRIILRGWQFGDKENASRPGISEIFQYSKDGIGLSQIAIAMPKGQQYRNLHNAIDLAISTLEASGQLQQMRNKWRLSEADEATVASLDTESTIRVPHLRGSNESYNVLSNCCHGSIINLSLFDSLVGLTRSRDHIRFSAGYQNSPG